MPAKHKAPLVNSPDSSQFFKRLDQIARGQSDNTNLANLVTATRRLLDNASAISEQVIRFLPQFTLHNKTHLWNVLGFMEELAGGKKEIQKLDAGDCAIAIWSAFIHDLGMVLEADELHTLDTVDNVDSATQELPSAASDSRSQKSDERAEAWRAYRDGHEHWATIRTAPNTPANRIRLGIIRASFIRDSHARDDSLSGHCRIADWLRFLATGDNLIDEVLNVFAIESRLVRVAVSHNQQIDWLPRQLNALSVNSPHSEDMGPDLGSIHWTWIGWLLRLADVFDCDASRTPRVLFEHSGIIDPRSTTEWRKHLAIPSPPEWNAKDDNQTLVYTCQKCPSPMVEKALHTIVGWMNDEIEKVRTARLNTPQHVDAPGLFRPSSAVINIKQREGGYLYHDMEFRLDRDAVVELLMGESLYGGPELALRELVQNALDAVHLRDMRNKLAEKLQSAGGHERSRQPFQSWGGQKPEVNVTWGEENGRKFIRVQDSGVGMTVGTMRRFLTQVGKSYYKSNDFLAEQELMRRNGILCSAISQFGIGFLSVFMLADNVTIHTRPVGVTVERAPSDLGLQETTRFPFRAEINGPHGLLSFYPDTTASLPGTSVTLWLRDKFVFAAWNRDFLLQQLRKEFYEFKLSTEVESHLQLQQISLQVGTQLLDPAFEISRLIVWPSHSVRLAPNTASDELVLNDSFHYRDLLPLDRAILKSKAAEWDHDIPEIEKTEWRVCEWVDVQTVGQGVEGTGSRIRLIGPQPEQRESPFSTSEWADLSEYLPSGEPRLLLGSFVEMQLANPIKRYQCLVNGVRIVPGFVPSNDERDCRLSDIIDGLPMLPGEGGWLWIDLRGSAMPRLRADRSAPVSSAIEGLKGLWSRWQAAWKSSTIHSWLANQIRTSKLWNARTTVSTKQNLPTRVGLDKINCQLLQTLVLNEAATVLKIESELPGSKLFDKLNSCAVTVVRHFDKVRGGIFFDDRNALRYVFYDALNRRNDRKSRISIDNFGKFERELVLAIALGSGRLDVDVDLIQATDYSRNSSLTALVEALFISDFLASGSSGSHPAVGRLNSQLTLGELQLVGPLHVKPLQDAPKLPSWINHFDLVAPIVAFSMPSLSEKNVDWGSEPSNRRRYVLPFLFGQRLDKLISDYQKPIPFDQLMLFLPNPKHYEWLFVEHSKKEWEDGSASVLWDVKNGDVLYADGIHDASTLRHYGKPLRKWLGPDV